MSWSLASTMRATTLARPRAFAARSRAEMRSTCRGLAGKNTSPIKSAPAAIAPSTVSGVDNPQILTSTGIDDFLHDRPRCRAWILGPGDGSSDHQEIRPRFPCRTWCCHPFLISGIAALGPHPRHDSEKILAENGFDVGHIMGAADDAIKARSLCEFCQRERMVCTAASAEPDLREITLLDARKHRHGYQLCAARHCIGCCFHHPPAAARMHIHNSWTGIEAHERVQRRCNAVRYIVKLQIEEHRQAEAG